MSQSCAGESREHAIRRNAVAFGPADGLALAASPTFALMALLSTVLSGSPAEMLCSPMRASPLSGMVTMYLSMSVFHAGPWLKLVRGHPPFGLRRLVVRALVRYKPQAMEPNKRQAMEPIG